MVEAGVSVEGMTDSASDEAFDVELPNELEIENRFVDASGYVFEGDVDDDQLYILMQKKHLFLNRMSSQIRMGKDSQLQVQSQGENTKPIKVLQVINPL